MSLRPVVICCSQRFKEDIELLLDGWVRLAARDGDRVRIDRPYFRHHRKGMRERPETERLQVRSYRARVMGLVHQHFWKMDVVANAGGVCFVYNPHGYIGSNTQAEISRAAARSMRIVSLTYHFYRSGTRFTIGEEWINGLIGDNVFTRDPKGPLPSPEELWRWIREYL